MILPKKRTFSVENKMLLQTLGFETSSGFIEKHANTMEMVLEFEMQTQRKWITKNMILLPFHFRGARAYWLSLLTMRNDAPRRCM